MRIFALDKNEPERKSQQSSHTVTCVPSTSVHKYKKAATARLNWGSFLSCENPCEEQAFRKSVFWRHRKTQKPCEALSSKIHSCASQNGAQRTFTNRGMSFVKVMSTILWSARKSSAYPHTQIFLRTFSTLCMIRTQVTHTSILTHRIYICIMYADLSTRPSMHCLHCHANPDSWRPVSCDLDRIKGTHRASTTCLP